MTPSHAIASIALASVFWDGRLTMAGSRALRHALDYRKPFKDYDDDRMVHLMDDLLVELREKGAQHMMVDAAQCLEQEHRSTAFAVAAEIMRSDGSYQQDEINILQNLANVLDLSTGYTGEVMRVMDALHAEL
ncbi:MAG: Tellurite resistance protein TerB [Synechococcus sp. XM-24]|jgi:tellurite resistance protein|nr:MAG: Tellurite resistance protein TerB [Synechococcus sp. XM-24]